jgi:hypothetical protein
MSVLFPSHAGFCPILRVLRGSWSSELTAVFALVRFFAALCSQKIMENRVDLAHTELLSIQQLVRVSVREVLRVKWCSSLGCEPF